MNTLVIGIFILSALAIVVIYLISKCKSSGSKCTSDTDCCKSLLCTNNICKPICTKSCILTIINTEKPLKYDDERDPLQFDLNINSTLVYTTIPNKVNLNPVVEFFIDTKIPFKTYTITSDTSTITKSELNNVYSNVYAITVNIQGKQTDTVS